ncbi:MAG: hypothetical protein IJS46_04985 [Kiritimatiellae bacterium]|nr:hypothetical protein [Kiritimatiellia bacterium]
MKISRIFRPERPSRGDTNIRPQQPIDEASWIWRAGADQWGGAVFSDTRTTPEALARMPQAFWRFRCDFDVAGGIGAGDAAPPGSEPLEIDVTADERYVLLLDGEELSRGPHRGLPNRWHYESVRIDGLSPGPHRLEAVCWQLGEHAPLAQRSIRGGFALKASGAYDGTLTTGKGAWIVAPLANTRMTHKGESRAFGIGSQCEVRGCSILDEEPPASEWTPAAVVRGPVSSWAGLRTQGWMLFPTPLPAMMRERRTSGRFVGESGERFPPFVVPAHATRTFLWDLGNYYCAYPELRVSGGAGAHVRWGWAECLTGPDGKKSDRAAFEGLDMPRPVEDAFLPDGRAGARFTTPWWRAGRWCRIVVETAGEPLAIDSVALIETRLPAALQASFEADEPFLAKMQTVCERSLQMCMHEMFFDCPYYEQQMYPGDSRVQYLVATLFGETGRRAVRNAIGLYDADRRENGQIPMNCPTRGTQESLPFSCCQAMMLGDLAWNHNDPATLRALFPGLVHTLLGMEAMARPDCLLGATPGWNFVDWVAEWPNGVPPDGGCDRSEAPAEDRPNCEINLEYLHALLSGEKSAAALGETALAAHFLDKADRLRAAIRAAFWCDDLALFASDTAHTAFSQHAQALALLAGVPPAPADARRCFEALVAPPVALARGSIYFRHYLFATYFKFGRPDLFFAGLDFWRECIEEWHCATVPEIPDPNSRSDCHGWGSHPLWHLHTGVAGVRSAAPFYAAVEIAPQPAHLRRIASRTPTPRGDVALDLAFDGNGGVAGAVTLPPGLPGVFRWAGRDIALAPGRNEI